MANQSGLIRIKGSLDGLSFYGKNGQYVRRAGGVEKARIMNSPNYQRLRENMSEFGGAATAAKSFRMAVAGMKAKWDKSFTGRSTGMMKQVTSAGTGLRGTRNIEILAQEHLIRGFEFSKSKNFRGIFHAPYQAPQLSADRNIVTLTVPDFDIETGITPPIAATHFQLALVAGVLSDFTYNKELKKYVPVNRLLNEKSAISYSDIIPLNSLTVGGDITLAADLALGEAVPADAGVIVAVGVLFVKEEFGQLYSLRSDNAMWVELVG